MRNSANYLVYIVIIFLITMLYKFDSFFNSSIDDSLNFNSLGSTNFNKIGKGVINYSLKGKIQPKSKDKETTVQVKSAGNDIHNVYSHHGHLNFKYKDKVKTNRKKKESDSFNNDSFESNDDSDFGF